MNSEHNINIGKCVQLEFCSSGRWNNANSYLYFFMVAISAAAQTHISGLRNGFFSTICSPPQKKAPKKREFLRNGHFIKLKIKKSSLKYRQAGSKTSRYFSHYENVEQDI